MKKLLLLIALISIGAFSQTNPSVFKNGVETKLIALDTLTTVQRDALTLKASKGYVIFNADTNSLNVYNGASWGDITGGGSFTVATPTEINTGTDNTKGITPLGLSGSNIQTYANNGQTAFGWGNHAGLYKPIGYVPAWAEITGKPTFATVATTNNFNDLINKPTLSFNNGDLSISGGNQVDLDSRYPILLHTHDLEDLTQSGATNGQVPTWNGSTWIPSTGLTNPMTANFNMAGYNITNAPQVGSNGAFQTVGISTNSIYAGTDASIVIDGGNAYTDATSGRNFKIVRNSNTTTGTMFNLNENGEITLPNTSISNINNAGSKSILTKEYADATYTGSASVSDTAYGAPWNGQTTTAPSQNAVYGVISGIVASATGSEQSEKFTAVGGETTWTLSNTPIAGYKRSIFISGIKQEEGVDYSISGNTVTWLGINNPLAAGDRVSIEYNDLTAPSAVDTSNFVDKTTAQTIAGNKTFISTTQFGSGGMGAPYTTIDDTGIIDASLIITNSIQIGGGTSSQFLKANGTVDNTTYLPITGNGSSLTGLTKSQVGLGNVDNTSDANKPISTATQTALNAKQATLVSGTNIKTVNGNSLLGSGDIVISGGGSEATTVSDTNSIDLTLSGTNISADIKEGFFLYRPAKTTLVDADELLINNDGTDYKTDMLSVANYVKGSLSGESPEITSITTYSNAASLPTITGSESDIYAYVTNDATRNNNGLYAIVQGQWKLIYAWDYAFIPIKRNAINWADTSSPDWVTGSTINSSGDIVVSAGKSVSNYIPVRIGDKLIRNIGWGNWAMYDSSLTLIPTTDPCYNGTNGGFFSSKSVNITHDYVKYIRWSFDTSDVGVDGQIVKAYDHVSGNAPTGWSVAHNYERDNLKYNYGQDGVISEKETNQLFNFRKAIYYEGRNEDGAANTSTVSSDFIKIKAGLPYSTSTGISAISFWDINKAFISGTSASWAIAPASAVYMKVRIGQSDDFKNISIVQSIKPDALKYREFIEETAINPISVCLIGDSIATEDDGLATSSAYATLMREALAIETFHNVSVSGKAVRDFQTNLNGGRYAMPVADMYIVALGTNDFAYNRAIGTVSDNAAADTFMGGLQDIIEGVTALNANAKIVFFTPIPRITQNNVNATGNKLNDYRNAVIKKAISADINYLDLFEIGLNPFNANILSSFFISSDGTHPNNNGHKLYAYPEVVKFMQKEIKRR